MIRRYLTDIVAITAALLMAFLFAGHSGINWSAHSSVSRKEVQQVSPTTEQKESEIVRRNTVSDDVLKGRNIFAESGSYLATAAATRPVLPPNPYKLISVLQGKEKKAVFRDYTGAVTTITAGQKMIDDFVLAKIENTSVMLRKDREEKELRLFSAGSGQGVSSDNKGKNIPLQPYTLIGILGGKEKKAVIRDYEGSVSILTVGGKLIDGSVIQSIEPVSVKLRRGKEQIELKIFGGRSS